MEDDAVETSLDDLEAMESAEDDGDLGDAKGGTKKEV